MKKYNSTSNLGILQLWYYFLLTREVKKYIYKKIYLLNKLAIFFSLVNFCSKLGKIYKFSKKIRQDKLESIKLWSKNIFFLLYTKKKKPT